VLGGSLWLSFLVFFWLNHVVHHGDTENQRIKQIKPKRLNSGTESGGGIGLSGTDGGKGFIERDEFFGVGVSCTKKSSELLFVSWQGA